MSKLTLEDVKRLARMSHLPIHEADLLKYPNQLTESISYVENLSEIDTSQVPDSFFTTEAQNVMAEDVVDESIMLTQDQALSNAPAKRNGYFVVKRIL